MNYFGAEDQEFRDELKKSINEVIAEIDDEIPNSKHSEASSSINLTVGNPIVSSGIPSDISHAQNLQLTVSGKKNTPLIFLSWNQWNLERLYDQNNDEPTHYTMRDGVLYVGPPPDQAYAGTFDYFKIDSELVQDASTSLITDHYARWERVVRRGAIWKMHEFLATDQKAIDKNNREFNKGIIRFRAWTRRNFNKSLNASRVRAWKEFNFKTRPFQVPEQFRRFG